GRGAYAALEGKPPGAHAAGPVQASGDALRRGAVLSAPGDGSGPVPGTDLRLRRSEPATSIHVPFSELRPFPDGRAGVGLGHPDPCGCGGVFCLLAVLCRDVRKKWGRCGCGISCSVGLRISALSGDSSQRRAELAEMRE